VIASVVALLALAGCGSSDPASKTAPELDTRLHKIDAAIVAQHWDGARKQLDALRDDAVRARQSGDLTADQANRIQAAVAALTDRLPASARG
jgi:hypothetical protein